MTMNRFLAMIQRHAGSKDFVLSVPVFAVCQDYRIDWPRFVKGEFDPGFLFFICMK